MRVTSEKLQRHATAFRRALEEYADLHPEDSISTDFLNPETTFPKGCCKSSAWMFGHYLRRIGVGDEISLVNGWHGRISHAWLEVDGLFVDLTADQFSDKSRSVIVLPGSDSEWHRKFAPHGRFVFDVSPRHISYTRAQKVADLIEAGLWERAGAA